ncbi:5897_t:CDS:2 [Entrophospora sp. SA101]|nr:14895_t:CDS:2 [Entrophospora sp. SA101]CAJ0769327.1 5897_t:CDS:2 [Entrophospora sp. SA101]
MLMLVLATVAGIIDVEEFVLFFAIDVEVAFVLFDDAEDFVFSEIVEMFGGELVGETAEDTTDNLDWMNEFSGFNGLNE